jgi:hypothetical protein
MHSHILVALVAGLVNMVLSLLIPCLLNKSEEPLLKNIKMVYKTNKQVIITSSIIVAITVYLAYSIVSELYPKGLNNNLGVDSTSDYSVKPRSVSNLRRLLDDVSDTNNATTINLDELLKGNNMPSNMSQDIRNILAQ